MARAMVAVVQAVGPHASMGHVIDVFRGVQHAPSLQPAAAPACQHLPAFEVCRISGNDFVLLLPAGANTAAVRKRHHEQLPVWGSGSQLTCGSQQASFFHHHFSINFPSYFSMLPLCCCRVHGSHV
jgi:hypothetical protein